MNNVGGLSYKSFSAMCSRWKQRVEEDIQEDGKQNRRKRITGRGLKEDNRRKRTEGR